MPSRVDENRVSSSLGGLGEIRGLCVFIRGSRTGVIPGSWFLRLRFNVSVTGVDMRYVGLHRERVTIADGGFRSCDRNENGTSLFLNSVIILSSVNEGRLSGWFGFIVGIATCIFCLLTKYCVIFFITTCGFRRVFLGVVVTNLLTVISETLVLLFLGKQLSIEGDFLVGVIMIFCLLIMFRISALVWYNRFVSWVNTRASFRSLMSWISGSILYSDTEVRLMM